MEHVREQTGRRMPSVPQRGESQKASSTRAGWTSSNAFDYDGSRSFAQHKPIRLRKPNHVDRDQGIVCEVYFCEDPLDVESMYHVVFAFKNTNERPVRISMEFFPDGTETHKVVPAESLKSKRVEPEGVLEMCRERHHFGMLLICRYRWTFTCTIDRESNDSNSSGTPLASVVVTCSRPVNVQTIPATIGPQCSKSERQGQGAFSEPH